ncbi:hypothetical protein DY000_02000796 [Brassica cretica]|uniref:Uncharacterized protein n=1 Tax=Brassica cretica TaxID=69181 RepID=A0ABQ7CJA0_BRACR|nr:hypothetical protein DY000_02000796 [Brassica cretica]
MQSISRLLPFSRGALRRELLFLKALVVLNGEQVYYVGVTEARFRHLGVVKWTKKIGVSPSPPCGALQRRPPYKRETEKSCRLFPPRAP